MSEYTEHQLHVFRDRYAARTRDGTRTEEHPDEAYQRVAADLAQTPEDYEAYRDVMSERRFLPAGRILAAAGTDDSATYYNCYVLDFGNGDQGRDSRGGIMSAMTEMIEVTARGGGVGLNWSSLRPSGAYIQGVQGLSSGPISWMHGADRLADSIRQGGTRTAALMFMLDCWHPDIVHLVAEPERFRRANYTIALGEAFMEAVASDGDWPLVFPDTSWPQYDRFWKGDLRQWERLGLPIVEHDRIPARELWRAICEAAWSTGNPGVCWLDRCNAQSPTYYHDRLVGMNPCGEQPLPANGVCNLGAVNLEAHVESGELDEDLLRRSVRAGVRMLDDVIDADPGVTEAIAATQAKVRRIGLGTMGLANALVRCGLEYGTVSSLDWTERAFRIVRDEAVLASAERAAERGPAPAYDERWLGSWPAGQLPDQVRKQVATKGIRNLALMSQAPTGTTSLLAGTSSGIEPVFSRQYERRDATGTHTVKHPLADDLCLRTAREIAVDDHIKMQAVVQQYVDSSISKTINLPNDATVEDVQRAYELAWELGCKGITVYRDGSLDGALIECPECSLEEGECS